MTDQLKEEENSTMDDIRESLIESTEPPPEPEAPQEKLTDPNTDPTANVETGAWGDDRAPSSWSPKVRESWAALPEDVRREIVRREEASVNGVRKLQEKLAPAERFMQSMSGVFDHARNNLKTDPEQYIATIMSAHTRMSQVDTKERFNMLMNLADVYQIPLRDIINQSVGEEVLRRPQRQQEQQQYAQLPPDVMQEIQTMRQYREGMEIQAVADSVNSFGADKEFFEDVRFQMGELIESGQAKDMQEAYDMAIWLDPEVRDVIIGRERADDAQQAIAHRQAAAARVNVGGRQHASPVRVADDDDGDDISDAIRSAFRQVTQRRV